MDGIVIVPTGEEHVEGFRRCVDAVARERRWIVYDDHVIMALLVPAPPDA